MSEMFLEFSDEIPMLVSIKFLRDYKIKGLFRFTERYKFYFILQV